MQFPQDGCPVNFPLAYQYVTRGFPSVSARFSFEVSAVRLGSCSGMRDRPRALWASRRCLVLVGKRPRLLSRSAGTPDCRPASGEQHEPSMSQDSSRTRVLNHQLPTPVLKHRRRRWRGRAGLPVAMFREGGLAKQRLPPARERADHGDAPRVRHRVPTPDPHPARLNKTSSARLQGRARSNPTSSRKRPV